MEQQMLPKTTDEEEKEIFKLELQKQFPHHLINKMSITSWKEFNIKGIKQKHSFIDKILEKLKSYSKTDQENVKPKKIRFLKKLFKKRKYNNYFTQSSLDITKRLQTKKSTHFLNILCNYANDIRSNNDPEIPKSKQTSSPNKYKKKRKSKDIKENTFEFKIEPVEHKLEIIEEKPNVNIINKIKQDRNSLRSHSSHLRLFTPISTTEESLMKNSSYDIFLTHQFDYPKKNKNFSVNKNHDKKFSSTRECFRVTTPSTNTELKSNSTKTLYEINNKYLEQFNKVIFEDEGKSILKCIEKKSKYGSSKQFHGQFRSKLTDQATVMDNQQTHLNTAENSILVKPSSIRNEKKLFKNKIIQNSKTSHSIERIMTNQTNQNNFSTSEMYSYRKAKNTPLKTLNIGTNYRKIDDYSSGKLLLDDMKILRNQIDKKGIFIQADKTQNFGIKFLSFDNKNVFNAGDHITAINSDAAIKFKNTLQNKFDIEFKQNEIFGIKRHELSKIKKNNGSSNEKSHLEYQQFYNSIIHTKRGVYSKHNIKEGNKKFD